MLTEQQIQQREEMFLSFFEAIAEELDGCFQLDESEKSVELSEEDSYLLSIMMEHFVENYYQPTLREATLITLMGDEDPNEELYEEIIEMMLDESAGSFVVKAAYGIRNVLAKTKQRIAGHRANKQSAKSTKAFDKLSAAKKAASSAPVKKGIIGTIKSTYHQGKIKSLAGKADKALGKEIQRNKAHNDAKKSASDLRKKSSSLQSKIDTGISNVKQKFQDKIKKGASKLGHAVGRIAGAVA